jgi:hypothetical protein
MGAKGDGKKKRKKKLDSPSPSPQPTSPQPATPRVSNDINIPIRRQIQYGKLNKQSRESAGTSFRQQKLVRTKYRRAWDEEEIELKAEERRRKGWSKFHLAFHILTHLLSFFLLTGSRLGRHSQSNIYLAISGKLSTQKDLS